MTPEQAEKFRYNVLDLTKVWPHAEFPLRPIGTMVLNENPKNYFAEVEQVSYLCLITQYLLLIEEYPLRLPSRPRTWFRVSSLRPTLFCSPVSSPTPTLTVTVLAPTTSSSLLMLP